MRRGGRQINQMNCPTCGTMHINVTTTPLLCEHGAKMVKREDGSEMDYPCDELADWSVFLLSGSSQPGCHLGCYCNSHLPDILKVPHGEEARYELRRLRLEKL